MLGVRHYGALEEDFVARITPCRAFRKMHQFTLRNLENELEPFVLKITNPYTPKGSSFSFFTYRKILFYSAIVNRKTHFLQKISKACDFHHIKNVLKKFRHKKFHFNQKTSIFHLFATLFSKHTKKTPNRNVWSKKIRANPRPALTRKTKL